MIKVLIVDNSAAVCALINQIFTSDVKFDVVGIASNGETAVKLNKELNPDLILMDITIPLIDGIDATRKILKDSAPVIVIYTNQDSADIGYKCLEAGASDVINKPIFHNMTADSLKRFTRQLYEIAASHLKKDEVQSSDKNTATFTVETRSTNISSTFNKSQKTQTTAVEPTIFVKPEKKDYKVLLIGASTGGPVAIQTLLQQLGPDFPLPILITQHIDNLFDNHFIKWLNETTSMQIELAKDGCVIQKGKAYVAPADVHMEINKNSRGSFVISLTDDPPLHFLRPAVDKLFFSGAKCDGRSMISVLLTGMGRDGADGSLELKNAGAYTIAEDKSSCIVYGMPKAAAENGSAMAVIPLNGIAKFIKEKLV